MINIVWQSIVLHTISFIIFALLLNKILFRPVRKVMEERKSKVANMVGKAESAEQEAERLQSVLQSRLEDARARAGELVEEFRVRADAEKAEILAATRAKVQGMREENARKLEQDMQAALRELEPEVKELGRLLAEKLIGRKLAAS